MGSSTLEKVGVNLDQPEKDSKSQPAVTPQIWIANAVLGLLVVVLASCSAKYLKYEKSEGLTKIDEFDKKVQIVIPEEEKPTTNGTTGVSPTAGSTAVATQPTPVPTPEPKKGKKRKIKPPVAPAPVGVDKKGRRQPELESDIGFNGRRPIKDPFRVGEKIVHQVHYYSISAGKMWLEVKPFATVNGRKTYNFAMNIRTSDWYSGIYSVDDKATILMDYETMVPTVFTLHVKETGQLKEARMLIEPGQATFWEKKVTEKHGEEERRLSWEIPEYTQNLFSGVYYMRAFHWDVGVENAFRVADDNENLIFRGKAIRKEKIKTAAGEFNAIVIQPQVELKGKYKPVGDIFVWLSDDDRKFILKIESKIKIGTLVSEIVELNRGKD